MDHEEEKNREKRRKLILAAKEKEDGFDRVLFEMYHVRPNSPSLEDIMANLDHAIADVIEEIRGGK